MIFRSPPWEDLVFWAVDLETTGFSPRRDAIVAAAAIPIRRGVICYGERWQTLVRSRRDPGEGLRAHHILPSELEHAPPLDEAMVALDRRLQGGVLLVHFATIDVAFLRAAYAVSGLRWPRPAVVDTVDLLHKLPAHVTPVRTPLREARAALGLPAYPEHDVMMDALATAELFLLLRARLAARTLRDLT